MTLADQYDLLLLDLDGVVYVGEQAVPGAAQALAEVRRRGTPVCYVTNNASRSPGDVADLLSRVGVPAGADEVLTSAQAAAELLVERFPTGSPVLVVGTAALGQQVAICGLTPVSTAADKPVAVVQGYGPEVSWRHLAEAAVALNDGAFWVATNTDRSVPSERGPLPGNGALVAAVAMATGKEPDVVVGKPQPELFAAAVRRVGARRPLVIGDRLDTDIEGAIQAGYDSVLVLTGVTTAAEALAASVKRRPDYLAADLNDLVARYPAITTTRDGGVRCRGWTVSIAAGQFRLDGAGSPVDALRALATAVRLRPSLLWNRIMPGCDTAGQALRQLGLPEVASSSKQRP
ncbi:MAG TPA: HAD-IIA family hydrolase [Micromonosporaceae bacterium]